MVFNLLLAAGLRSLIERLLGQKRLREAFVVLLVMVGALPQLLIVTGIPKTRLLKMMTEKASVLWPWIAASQLSVSGPAAIPWIVLLVWTAAAYLFGRWQFESNLSFDFQAAEATNLDSGRACRRFVEIATVPPALRLASRSGRRDRGKGTAHADAHAALPAGLHHGLHVRSNRLASA